MYFNPQPKTKAWRSKAYLKWLRKQPPLISGTGETVTHHVRFLGGGVGMKPGDDCCIPIADSVHRQLHQKGEKKVLCKLHGYDEQTIADLCAAYKRVWERECLRKKKTS